MTSKSFATVPIGALIFVLAAFALPPQPAIRQIAPLWKFTGPRDITSFRPASNGNCAAASAAERVIVLDSKGKVLWQTISDPISSIVALSPQCDWIAITSTMNGVITQSDQLEMIGKDRRRLSIPIDSAAIKQPPARISALDISPDGALLIVGLAIRPEILIVKRSGEIIRRITLPDFIPQIDLKFAGDGKQILITGWGVGGLLTVDGNWVFRTDTRNFAASRNLDLLATFSGAMHGAQNNELRVLDRSGKLLWRQSGWNGQMAVAHNGQFVVMSAYAESPNQPTAPPFPVVPNLMESPGLSIRDRSGRTLIQRAAFEGFYGISEDSSCILTLWGTLGEPRLQGLDLQLKPNWQIATTPDSQFYRAGQYHWRTSLNTISAYPAQSCTRR